MSWPCSLKEGDSIAARAIWDRYFPKILRLAYDKLQGTPRLEADEEDVATSVMESLFLAAQKGRFPNLADRHDLWRLLLWMTARKVVDFKRREGRKCRGGGRAR